MKAECFGKKSGDHDLRGHQTLVSPEFWWRRRKAENAVGQAISTRPTLMSSPFDAQPGETDYQPSSDVISEKLAQTGEAVAL